MFRTMEFSCYFGETLKDVCMIAYHFRVMVFNPWVMIMYQLSSVCKQISGGKKGMV